MLAKFRAVQGTAVGFFNANVPIPVDSISGGGPGFSGIAANAYPSVVAHAVRQARKRGPEAGRLQQFLTVGEPTLSVRYPLSAQLMATQAGVPIAPVCRRKVVELTAGGPGAYHLPWGPVRRPTLYRMTSRASSGTPTIAARSTQLIGLAKFNVQPRPNRFSTSRAGSSEFT